MPLALGAPAAVVAAIFALMFLLAWHVWGNSIKETLNVDIGVGPFSFNLFGWVGGILDKTYFALLYVLDGVVQPVAAFIYTPVGSIERMFTATQNAIAQLAAASTLLTGVIVPNIYASIGGYAGGVQSDIVHVLQNASGQLGQALSNLDQSWAAKFSEVIGEFHGNLNALRNEMIDRIAHAAVDTAAVAAIATTAAQGVASAATGPLRDLIDTDYANAISNAANLFQHAELDIGLALTTAEAYTDAAIAGITGIQVTDISDQILAGLSGIWPDIAAVIPELEGVIGTGDIDILDALGRIDWTIPANLAAVASLVGVTTLTMARFLRDCGVPNCKNLSALGNDLQSLFGLVGDAAFLAFIVGLIHDPEGAADTVASTVGGVIGESVDLTRNLVGI